MSLLASRFPEDLLGDDRLSRVFAHLFCLDDDLPSEGRVRRVFECHGVKDEEDQEKILQVLNAVPCGGKYDFTSKNRVKRELLKESGKKFALVTGREDLGHAHGRYKEELARVSVPFDEYYLESFSYGNGGVSGFPMKDDYHAVIISNLEPLESDSAPVFLFKEDMLGEISKKYFTLPTVRENLPARSKLATLRMFNESTIRTPRTLVTASINNALEFVVDLHQGGKDAVVKPLAKGGGWAVSRITRAIPKSRILDILGKYKWWYGAGILYLQEFIENAGYDKRALILDGIIIGVEKRVRKDDGGSWIYNISKGALGEETTLDDDERELALAAFNATNQFFSGVDIISDVDGNAYVLEVNSSPGFGGFEKYLEFNVASFVVSYLALFID